MTKFMSAVEKFAASLKKSAQKREKRDDFWQAKGKKKLFKSVRLEAREKYVCKKSCIFWAFSSFLFIIRRAVISFLLKRAFFPGSLVFTTSHHMGHREAELADVAAQAVIYSFT